MTCISHDRFQAQLSMAAIRGFAMALSEYDGSTVEALRYHSVSVMLARSSVLPI